MRQFFLSLMILMMMTLMASCSKKGDDYTLFTDPAFKKCVQSLDKKFVDIKKLDCSNTDETLKENPFGESTIKSISGLSKLVNLEKLELRRNKISDIKPLTNLAHLSYVDLSNNEITHIKPLSTLPSIKTIILKHNLIGDLRPLQGIKTLEVLDMSENSLQGLIDFDGMPLKKLSIDSNHISSIEKVGKISTLEEFSAADNAIIDIFHLEPLQKLKKLNLRKNRIDDLIVIGKMPHLEEFDISDNQVRVITSLKNHPGLKKLNVYINAIVDFSPLESIEKSGQLKTEGKKGQGN